MGGAGRVAVVVVVGAGIGGLAAAVRLAAAGHDVTVCEQTPDVGGKLGWYTRDGFSFDTGPSLLTMPHVFGELFAAAGADLRAAVELHRLDPIARYRFADGTTVDAHAGDEAFAAELDARLGRGAGAQWRRLDAYAARIWATVEQPFLRTAVSPSALARMALRRPADLVAVAPGRTLRGLGRAYLDDPRLRMFWDRYATYAGSDPRRAPAALAVVGHVERRYGGWYISGGLHRLATAVAELARERGARIRCQTRVSAITRTDGGRVSGVRLAGGGHLPADIVVANADAAQVYGSLVDHYPSRVLLRRLPPSMAGFVLLLALTGSSPGGAPRLAHHTVTFPADYDAEFDAVFGGRLATDPAVYVSAPPDPALAPTGCEAWFVLVNAAPHARAPRPAGLNRTTRGLDWDRPGLADAYARHILDVLAARGIDVRDRLLWYQVLTPADTERHTGAVGGSIYGPSSNGMQAAFLRPPNASGVPGLFLVGGSSHPGGGLPLVALSASIVAEAIGPA
jgi:phytoene desaturase